VKLLVTGATGFVGAHVVGCLLAEGHDLVAIARNREKAQTMPWYDQVEFIQCDLHHNFQPALEALEGVDAVLHLAWPGLPNYKGFFHIDQNLPADLLFLKAVVEAGIRHLLVAGTCLEYGMQYGPLREDMETKPTTPYGLAKDCLRKSLQLLQTEIPFVLQWVRLFYMFGEGQNPKSLLAQLDRAIAQGEPVFNMSQGDQLRDYLPVVEVANIIARLVVAPDINGVINCCSGKPVSIVDLVTQRCQEKNSPIALNRGYYAYPDYEPMAFWGVPAKLDQLR
jgi:dTDP-6-deoxy-L-talose 4-dehydrogenase (NAD+)